MLYRFVFFLLILGCFSVFAKVKTGLDLFFEKELFLEIKDKRIGLITNHTSIDHQMRSSIELFLKEKQIKLTAIFSPEHGINGSGYAFDKMKDSIHSSGIPIFSLHGATKRPTKEMLKNIDLLIFDMQDIGTRSYSYISTLFLAMEEAAKHKIDVIVLDRPNPMGGLIVDGPMLEEKWRSFLGYINVPYCHGMTVGELANFFNQEYKVNCSLKVIAMQGWRRAMTFQETKLPWVPPSPNIPEAQTTLFFPATGILGELRMVSIGIGYTLPFKVVGAPWIDADLFAEKLNQQNLKGVYFMPFHFRPFFGRFKAENCHGVMIVISDNKMYKPLSVQYLLLGMLKSMYPNEFKQYFEKSKSAKELFCKVNGSEHIYELLQKEKYVAWKLIEWSRGNIKEFEKIRKKYLIYD